ncbi:MAG: PPE domain-containing protein [Pseudonocardiaceae bacterium]
MGTSIDYSTVAHETIYHHITSGLGSTELMDTSQNWRSVAAQLEEIQNIVDHAVRGIGTAQQGVAADAATRATMALMPWVAEIATTAIGMAARVGEQAAVFAHTRDSMPPPRSVPEVSFSQEPGTWMADHAVEWLPGIQTEHERAAVAAQQDEQRARELMSGYQGTANEILATRQHFTVAPAVVAEVAPPAPGGVGVGGANGGGSTHPSTTNPGVANPGVAYPAAARSATSHPPVIYSDAVTGGHSATVAPAATTTQLASGVHHAPAAVSPQLAGGYPSLGEEPMAGSGSVQPAAAAPFGPSPMITGSPTTGEDRRRGRSRSSGGGFGPRPSAAFGTGDPHLSDSPGHSGPGHSGPLHSSPVHSSPVHSGLGHGGAEQAGAGRPGHGGAGFTDAPLGATGGVGRGGDTVHRRPSYLLEQDTNAIVGELPLLAPPVIGAEDDYR